VVASGMSVTGQRMTDENSIALLLIELAVGFVGDLNRCELAPGRENQWAPLVKEERPLGFDEADGPAVSTHAPG
jgi:hypothetical protein